MLGQDELRGRLWVLLIDKAHFQFTLILKIQTIEMDEVNLDTLLDKLDTSVAGLQPDVKQLISKSLNERISNTSSSAESVEIINNYTYTLVKLLTVYLQLLGEDPSKHAVNQEVERVKRYIDKYRRHQQKHSKALRVNTEAAQRFIKATVGGSTLSSSTPVIRPDEKTLESSKENGGGSVEKKQKKKVKTDSKVLKPTDKKKRKKKVKSDNKNA